MFERPVRGNLLHCQIGTDHLAVAAKRHEILLVADVASSASATDAAHVLVREIKAMGAKKAALLIRSGTIGDGRLQLLLSPEVLAERLGVEPGDLNPNLLDMNAPFTIRRRGAEMKIVAGEQHPEPDKTLIRALRNAHAWVAQMKTGTSIKQIATTTSVSESYITRIVPMAFLSPRIQQSILTGAHPVNLTLESIARARLPMAWSAQEQLLGFAKSA